MALSSQHQRAASFGTLPPELQQNIFNHLAGDVASLSAAIHVSKICYKCCVGMLWRSSTQKSLAKVSTPARRQYHANMICDWILDLDCAWKLFDGLEFPLLKSISFSGGSLSVTQLHHWLQRGLQSIRFVRCELDAATLFTIGTCCTQLQELEMNSPDTTHLPPDQFMRLLRSFPALRRLRLEEIAKNIADKIFAWKGKSVAQLEVLSLTDTYGTSYSREPRNDFLKRCTGLRELYLDRADLLSADVLTQLSGQTSLEVLHLGGWTEGDVLEQVKQQNLEGTLVSRPFPSIKKLSLEGYASEVKDLFFDMPTTLVDLNLKVHESRSDNDYSICLPISRLSNLVRLSIRFDHSRILTRTDLDLISELPNLQKCHINQELPYCSAAWGDQSDDDEPWDDEAWNYEAYDDESYDDEPSYRDQPWFTDRYFKDWIYKLPRLRDLSLDLHSSTISHLSLQFLADSCPLLTECHLGWKHDLLSWTCLKSHLFPNLLALSLDTVKDHGYQESQATIDEDARRDAKVIWDLAPDLRSFQIESRHRHERALMAAFRAGT